ncbi:hypothetical protein G8C93_00810 [Cellulosimicrobium cellulans]|uniref:hypothetical protein n=1 Tax=Cellulosimicrobium cellulans TaxID=1710 RepID=UPI001883747B|nr:hypothetical protein [Cellulosimicrobium cellulans]MBE9924432.1 hypothetical protein [Cellulosimicrobium cellulans]
MLVYATSADLVDPPWSLSTLPANVDQLLVAASLLVLGATRSAVYRTDADGYPLDPVVRAAFLDATCSQVTTWIALGIDPAAAGADAATSSGRVVAAKSFGPASVSYVGVEGALAERVRLAGQLTNAAALILATAGLDTRVQVLG